MPTNTKLQTIRTILWIGVALAIIAFLAIYLGNLKHGIQGNAKLKNQFQVSEAFELTAQNGEKFSSSSLAGKPYLIFFGFTHCPDICPTTLLEVTNTLKELGDKANALNAVFVTVDPKRDTQEALQEYLKAFDPRIIGLTGSEEDIARVAKLYLATYKKVPGSGGNYTMDHTASVLLFDREGKLVSTLNWQEPAKFRRKKLENLVAR